MQLAAMPVFYAEHNKGANKMKKRLKFGHCLEGAGGGGVPGLPKLFGALFLVRGEFFYFFLQGYYRGITRILCVIFLQFIGFSLKKHSNDIWNINTHPGEVLLRGPL